jgi:hypothetical protein
MNELWNHIITCIWNAMCDMDKETWDRNRVKWKGWCPVNEMEYFT